MPENSSIGRRRPVHGLYISSDRAPIIFLTVCTQNKEPWLAHEHVHAGIRSIWQSASAWLVGHYVLMPDHLHLFCVPNNPLVDLTIWVGYWKRAFSCLHLPKTGKWQRDFWDTRLRREEKYNEKWEYVSQNPVRRGLVQTADEWPFQGSLNVLEW